MELQFTSKIEQLQSTNQDLLVQLEEKNKIIEKSTETSLENYEQYQNKIDKLQSELEESKTKTDTNTGGFKDVSILNQYLKEIYQLKNDNTILTQRFDSTKKLLEQSQKDNKHLREIQKELSFIPTIEQQKQVETIEKSKEEPEEEEEAEEIDVSKLDIIEVDDVEYYLDLDNQIRDKETLNVIGKVTDDGDAIFN
jgi:hypothetical protein